MRYFKDERLNDLALQLRSFAESEQLANGVRFPNAWENKVIVSICKKLPTTPREIADRGIPLGKERIEQYGDRICAIVKAYLDNSEDKPQDSVADTDEDEKTVTENSSVSALDKDGVITIRQAGFYYNISGNDAFILHKHFGYKLYGATAPRTGFPVNGADTVLKKLNELSINYDVYNKEGELVVSQRFDNNAYEIIEGIEWQRTARKRKSKKNTDNEADSVNETQTAEAPQKEHTTAPMPDIDYSSLDSKKQQELIRRAKIYIKLMMDGIHPVSGERLNGSPFDDEKVRRCFSFVSYILDEHSTCLDIEALAYDDAPKVTVLAEKKEFDLTPQQCSSIELSKKPLTVTGFMKNINSVIDASTTEKLTSTRINKWLIKKGLYVTTKVPTVVNKNVNKPSELAVSLGIIEEEIVDTKTGEVKSQIKFSESAQLFIIENLREIIETT